MKKVLSGPISNNTLWKLQPILTYMYVNYARDEIVTERYYLKAYC